MVLRSFLCSSGFLFLYACSGEGNEPIQADIEENNAPGKAFFEERCIQCHGFDGTDCLAGAADLSKSSMEDDSIRLIIQNGKNAMPPFKAFIETEDELNEVIDYVKSLKR